MFLLYEKLVEEYQNNFISFLHNIISMNKINSFYLLLYHALIHDYMLL